MVHPAECGIGSVQRCGRTVVLRGAPVLLTSSPLAARDQAVGRRHPAIQGGMFAIARRRVAILVGRLAVRGGIGHQPVDYRLGSSRRACARGSRTANGSAVDSVAVPLTRKAIAPLGVVVTA
ncbi:MAG: hypothetical protein QOG01_990 [Pseudonocardiales bacterium]|nr:hypothetical protein [Pseudonocardiales bacterium]